MNTKQVQSPSSGGALTLPEPDPDNITVLAHSLPNKPILPWNHYDSPWQDAQAENADEQAQLNPSEGADETEAPDNQVADATEQQPPTPIDNPRQLE